MLLLHISDIHFRQGDVGTAMDPNVHIRAELLRDAEDQCRKIGAAPDAVLITGDLTFGGQVTEYEFALTWLESLCARCGTTTKKIFAVPGNHDVVRATASHVVTQSIHREIKQTGDMALDGVLKGFLTDKEAGPLLYKSLGNFNAFAGQFFCDLLPPERTVATRDLILNDGSILRLSGLNSAFLSSAADKAGDLFVDPACFQITRERGTEHLVMCHHPYSWLRQGDALRDHLKDIARIHLFGHEHTNRIDMGRDWVQVAASAAHPDKTENGWEPGYNLIELSVEGDVANRALNVGIHVRVWQARPGMFRAKVDRNGAHVFRQKINLDPWTPPAEAPVAISSPDQSETGAAEAPESGGIDPMDSLRDISIRFFRLTLSQKAAIAGKLNLLEEEDTDQPDFERSRRVFIRARERNLVEALDQEINVMLAGKAK